MEGWIFLPFLAILLFIIVFWLAVRKILISKKDKKLFHDLYESSPYRHEPPIVQKPKKFTDQKLRGVEIEKEMEKEKKEEAELEKVEKLKRVNTLEPAKASKIVGVAEPKGFWSRFVLGQKLGYIISRLTAQNEMGQGGFWQSFIKAQDMSQGKDQSKGR